MAPNSDFTRPDHLPTVDLVNLNIGTLQPRFFAGTRHARY